MRDIKFNNFLSFLKQYPFFIIGGFLAFCFVFIILLSLTSSNSTANPNQNTRTLPSTGLTAKPSPKEEGLEESDEYKHIYSPDKFSEKDLGGVNSQKQILKDGSVQYSFSSTNPVRPNLIIVRNGITILQRKTISKVPLSSYKTFFGKPEFIKLGSGFYGLSFLNYVYPSLGISVTVDTNTGFVVEQSVFETVSLEGYKKIYPDVIKIPSGELKKESFNNGTVRYSFSSLLPQRPNIIITKGLNEIIFQRLVKDPNFSNLPNIIKNFGTTQYIFNGSTNYGPLAQSYIYSDLGIAYIANPQTGEVFEQQIFSPTKAEDYINKYGDDIPAQP